MFDIGWSELVVIGVVALIAIGPKELPGVLRAVGQWTGKIRRMASEFQGQFQEAMREAEMADVKKQVDDISSSVKDYANIDPLAAAQKEIDKSLESVRSTSVEPAPPPIDAPPLPAHEPLIDVPPAPTLAESHDAPVKPGSGAS